MDDPLREMDAKAKDGAVVVLILVVMDDPLRAEFTGNLYADSTDCLNPCCNG